MVLEKCQKLKYHTHMLSRKLDIEERDTDSENPICALVPALLWTSCLLTKN